MEKPAHSSSISNTNVHVLLKSWNRDSISPELLDTHIVQRLLDSTAGNRREASRMLLDNSLNRLEQTHPRDAHILRVRFIDDQKAVVVAKSLNIEMDSLYKMQRRAIERLAEIVLQLESEAEEQTKELLLAKLDEPVYNDLFGIGEIADSLSSALRSDGPPWIFVIEGLGGIGKTTLADIISRRAIMEGSVRHFGWVSARQESLSLTGSIRSSGAAHISVETLIDHLLEQCIPEYPTPVQSYDKAVAALQQHVKEHPHLLVIDNLESAENMEVLLPTIRRLANPTRFLLTSRISQYGEGDVYHVRVPELNMSDALGLVRHEATIRNLPQVVDATDSQLSKIYETTGGNPLALRLIVGQMHMHGLDTVVDDLKQARGKPVQNLYTFIFRRAWEHLDEITRRTLLAMPLIATHGGNLETIGEISGISSDAILGAINQLVTLNLVDSRGTLNHRLYTIHSLTRTFLEEQVARWA
jgi:hypothetical protein